MAKKKGKKRHYGKWGRANAKGAYKNKKGSTCSTKDVKSYIKSEKKKNARKKNKKVIRLIRKGGGGQVHIWDELNNDTKCKLFTVRNGIRSNWEITEKMFLPNERCCNCYK